MSSSSGSSSESEEEEESKVEPVASKVDIDKKFRADLELDECEIVEREDYIEIRYGAEFG